MVTSFLEDPVINVKNFCPNISFKGNRDYIQGGDIYDSVCKYLQCEKSDFFISKLTLNKKIDTSFFLDVLPKNIFGSIQLRNDSGEITNLFLNQTSQKILSRREYSEELIEKTIKIKSNRIEASFTKGFSTIEHIISINKSLNNSTYPHEDRKWIFVRVILKNRLPKMYKNLLLKIEKTANSSFTVCSINIDNIYQGDVHFVLEKK